MDLAACFCFLARMNPRALSLLLPVLLLSACALGRQGRNDPLDPVLTKHLQPGVTTAKQVVELLGGPNEVVQLGRRSAYFYEAEATKTAGLVLILVNLFNQDARTDRLWVFFDEADILTHWGATWGTHRVQYAFPWEDVHEPEDNEVRDAERPGVELAAPSVEGM